MLELQVECVKSNVNVRLRQRRQPKHILSGKLGKPSSDSSVQRENLLEKILKLERDLRAASNDSKADGDQASMRKGIVEQMLNTQESHPMETSQLKVTPQLVTMP